MREKKKKKQMREGKKRSSRSVEMKLQYLISIKTELGANQYPINSFWWKTI